jgi:hypothetical protein
MSPFERVRQIVAALFVTMILSAVGWQAGISPVVSTLGNWIQARDYIEVPAVQELRTFRDSAGVFNAPVLRYERDGKTYETARMSVLDDLNLYAASNEAVNARLSRTGAATTVWVSPRRPDVALATRDMPWASLLLRLLLALPFGLLAATGLSNLLRAADGMRPNPWHRLSLIAAWGTLFVVVMRWLMAYFDLDLSVDEIVGLTILLGFGALVLAGSLKSLFGRED